MRKKSVRIIAIIIVVVMVLGVFSGVLSIFAWASEARSIEVTGKRFYKTNGSVIQNLKGFAGEFNAEIFITAKNFDDYTHEKVADISGYNLDINGDRTIGVVSETDHTYKLTVKNLKIQDISDSISIWFNVSIGSDADHINNETKDFTVTLYEPEDEYDSRILTADTTVSPKLTAGKAKTGITVKFYFILPYELSDDKITIDYTGFSIKTTSSFGWSKSSKLTIRKLRDNNSEYTYEATVTGIDYDGGGERTLEINVDSSEYIGDFIIPISNKYFTDSAAEEEDTPPVSDIVVQSVHALNIDGEPLSEVTKDTPPFSVRITFYDVGLKDVSKTVLKESEMRAFITSATGFKTLGGTVGEIEILTSNAEYPRFQATFKNLTSDGSATSIGFRVQYDLKGFGSEGLDLGVKGEATANLFQVTEIKDEESSKDEAVPLKPNVIVQEYSYTNEENPTVTAGEEFDLELKIHNTSKSTGVENIVMTIEPNDGFVIADASNTVYFSSIAPDEVKPFSIALRAMPSAGNAANATPTDYSLQVKFSYQYLSAANKYEGPVESGGKIAIPVEQLDRFAVEEITEYSQMLTVGEEGTVTVPVINKGKSLIYNISGLIRAVEPFDFISPITHIGNLEAGKSGTIDLPITINEPGEFTGEAVISYEDENSNVKELTATFTILVNEMYIPPVETPSGPVVDVDAPKGPSAVSVASCLVGALMVASPIGLYLVKRAKSRGIEDFDEDF